MVEDAFRLVIPGDSDTRFELDYDHSRLKIQVIKLRFMKAR